MSKRPSLTARANAAFWDRTIPEPNMGCWLWLGAFWELGGYGQVRRDGRVRAAHRLAYELAVGPIPDGLLVCHRCDVRACVNPGHLFLGTYQDNMDDMARKGRKVVLRGDRNGMRKHPERAHRFWGESGPNAKLKEAEVREIRRRLRAGERQPVLAADFGVSRSNISRINTGDLWPGVE